MRCVYCLEESSKARSVPHALPESIAANRFVLPLGTECDSCNRYLGHELDNELVAHPVISLMLQFLALPGKKGIPRQRLGNVTLNLEERWIEVPTSEPIMRTLPDGSREATAQPLLDGRFNLFRFRRALHRVAFGVLVLQDGVERAMASEFDPLRRYVRSPHRGESWPYAQYVDLLSMPKEIVFYLAREEGSEILGIRIVGAAFAVDLLNSGQLRSWAEKEFPPDMQYVEESHRVVSERKPLGRKRYRMRIMLDE